MGLARAGAVVTGVHRARVRAVTGRVVVLAAVAVPVVAAAVGVETAVAAGAIAKRARWGPVSASSPS
ncbi:hypothetical protein MYMAC_004757 [Corallococcus macrosporus DSM 14697]|uniref:Uncharacterized protein n=1 Tax=Corallococcus macrosporus DSM 14697 TaxID=1189310 RepID=A0A250JZJ7_9BACT|nr:hypothetical protein MYMAC_004757 [Corallococcus macrosporus DSM 14697]